MKIHCLGRRRTKFLLELRRRIDPVVIHGITTVVAVVCMALIQATLHMLMGHDARIWDRIPLRYCVEAIDLVMLVRFAVNAWRDLR